MLRAHTHAHTPIAYTHESESARKRDEGRAGDREGGRDAGRERREGGRRREGDEARGGGGRAAVAGGRKGKEGWEQRGRVGGGAGYV